MAFHRGALRALDGLGLVESIGVVSTVSGGSVFGAAWLCSRLEGKSTPAFLDGLVELLKTGFIRAALCSPRALRVLLPGFTRSERLAEVFSTMLFGKRKLSDLPESPKLCLNAAAMNHAMPARFSRDGFSCSEVGAEPGSLSYPVTALSKRDLGYAVAASACFPFVLAPLTLKASELPEFKGRLTGLTELQLTDGGVLENLGVERLLAPGHFEAENIICCDAGVADSAWSPTLGQRLLSFLTFAMSRQTLARLLIMMNDKQNKTMRKFLMRATGVVPPPAKARALWLVQIDQTWDGFFKGISEPTRRAIGGNDGFPAMEASAEEVVAFLEKHGIDLASARKFHVPEDFAIANATGTNFTGLPQNQIDALARHASWQMHACKAVFGRIEPTRTETADFQAAADLRLRPDASGSA